MTDNNKIQANSFGDNTIQASLTEQWNKGELPEGDYYIKRRNGILPYDNIDSRGVWRNSIDEDIVEVLAPVPTYEEYQALLSDQLAKNEGVEINAELKAIIKKREIKIKELYETIDIFADSNLDLIKNIETLAQTLLKVSPEHREWLETNFKEYL